MNQMQSEMWNVLCSLTAATAVGVLTDYHGLQLLDTGLYQHMIDEGLIEDHEDELDQTALEQLRREAIEDDDFMGFCSTYDWCYECPVWRERKDKPCEDTFDELYRRAGDEDV